MVMAWAKEMLVANSVNRRVTVVPERDTMYRSRDSLRLGMAMDVGARPTSSGISMVTVAAAAGAACSGSGAACSDLASAPESGVAGGAGAGAGAGALLCVRGACAEHLHRREHREDQGQCDHEANGRHEPREMGRDHRGFPERYSELSPSMVLAFALGNN